jgi:hypothetical protein
VRKLSEGQVGEIRALYASGRSQKVLAAEFGVSPSYLSRLVSSEARAGVAPAMSSPVRAALDEWLRSFELSGADRVRARMLEALASKTDACASSGSAAAAAALPRVIGMLEEQLRLVAATNGAPHLDVDRLLSEVLAS